MNKESENGERTSILSTGGAREQTVLPTKIAFQLCLSGIRTRLGRSLITLSGVALGIAFLCSVLTGFHLRESMRTEAAIRREAVSNLAMLRGEIGRLDNKNFWVVNEGSAPENARFLEILENRGGTLVPEWRGADVILILAHQEMPPSAVETLAQSDPAARILSFKLLSDEENDHMQRLGINVRRLVLEFGKTGDERMNEQDEKQARMRMGWIVGISLLITVVSVTNALLMSVTERFREIATMKCLGALSGFVVKLFLIESAIIGAAGSIAGVVIGMFVPLVTYTVTFGADRLIGNLSLATLSVTGGGCLLIGTILSMAAGIYPARVAARMIPAAALRSQV